MLLPSADAPGGASPVVAGPVSQGHLPRTLDIAREPAFPARWWDPGHEPDVPWREWYEQRYGTKPPSRVLKALRRTGTVLKKSTSALGMTCTPADGQIVPMFRGPGNAWDALKSHVESLEATAPRQARLGRELMQCDEELILRVVADRELAVRLAEASLVDLERARPKMVEADYEELRHYLALGADCASHWRQVGEAFFRGLQVRCAVAPPDGPLSTLGSDVVARLATICNELIGQALSLEGKYGTECWPVFPRGQGTTVYECVVEMYADLIDVVRRIEPPALGGEELAERDATSVEGLWRAVIAAARGEGEQEIPVSLDDGLDTCDFTSSGLVLIGAGGRLLLPTGATTRGPRLHAGEEHRLSIRREGGGIVVEHIAGRPSA